jgi:DNA polymerase III epsilon subunit-like protein
VNAVIARTAHRWLSREPVFIHTEHTGPEPCAEVCEIAVLGSSGAVLLQSVIKPTVPLDPRTETVHGITSETVRGAPSFREIAADLRDLLSGRLVVAYNLERILRALHRSADARRVPFPGLSARCAMLLHAAWRSEWDPIRRAPRRYVLDAAVRQCGLELPSHPQRAASDAELTRRLLHYIAEGNDVQTVH